MSQRLAAEIPEVEGGVEVLKLRHQVRCVLECLVETGWCVREVMQQGRELLGKHVFTAAKDELFSRDFTRVASPPSIGIAGVLGSLWLPRAGQPGLQRSDDFLSASV